MIIVYVAEYLMQDGPKVSGRSLVRHLSVEHEVRVCGAVVADDAGLLDGPLARDVVPVSELAVVDVVYMEGGWNRDGESIERFPLECAAEFTRRGGQLLVADIDRNTALESTSALARARGLFATGPSIDGRGVRYLRDEDTVEPSGFQRFVPAKMRIGDILKGSWDGIDSVLTWGAIDLAPGADIVASGHEGTAVLVLDRVVTNSAHWPWATVNQYGAGHVVVIGALISPDGLIDECSDNARWISNMMALLVDRSNENRFWRDRQFSRSPSGPNPVELLQAEESQSHERKASFLTPVDVTRSEVGTKVLQGQVGKSIAALANTDGGNVVIGQADDGTLLGLDADLRSLGKRGNRDGFEQRLVAYVSHVMHPSWEYVGLRLSWVEQDGKSVAIVHVPRCKTPVYLDYDSKKEVIFVRRGTRTDALEGRRLAEWLSKPRD